MNTQDIIAQGNAINQSQAEDQARVIPYRPQFNLFTGRVTASLLLQQIRFWWFTQGRKPFYKFKQPCDHDKYRDGDSWCEELGFSRSEFDGALQIIGTKITRGTSKTEALKHSLVIYWTDSDRVTWYQLNEDLCAVYVYLAYNDPELLGKAEKRLYLDNAGNVHYLDKDENRIYPFSEITIIENHTNPANAGPGLVQEKQEPELPVEEKPHIFVKEYPPLEHKVVRPGLVATLQNPYGPDHYTDISIPPEAKDIRCEVCGEEQNWPRKKALRRKEKSLTCSNAAGCGAYFRVRIEGTPEAYALKLPSKEWLIKIESAPPGFQELETTQEHLDNLLKCWAEDPGEYIGTMQWYAMQVHPGVRRLDVVIQRCNTGFDSKMAKKTASQQPSAPPPIIDHNITLVKPGYLM